MLRQRNPILKLVSIVIIAGLTAHGFAFSGNKTDQEDKSLYERLGGLQGISLVVSDFVDVFIQDPVIMANPAVRQPGGRVSIPDSI
jgi:hemoglobin